MLHAQLMIVHGQTQSLVVSLPRQCGNLGRYLSFVREKQHTDPGGQYRKDPSLRGGGGSSEFVLACDMRFASLGIVNDRLFLDEDQETARATKLRTIGDVSPRR